MSLEAWLAFCAMEAVLCLIPGPAVLCVVSTAVARGTRAGLMAGLGILTANTLYFALSATGIAAVIAASAALFRTLKWGGAAYLVWVGIRMLRSAPPSAVAASPEALRTSFLRGFVVQAANPKALVFFVALLPQFIDPRGAVVPQLLILGASSIAIELVVLSLYAGVASRARDVAGGRFAHSLERVGGALLVAAGARLALLRV